MIQIYSVIQLYYYYKSIHLFSSVVTLKVLRDAYLMALAGVLLHDSILTTG